MANLKTVKIFPSIGIARIGNSPEWYLGPELPFPAPPPAPVDGKYKDDQCRIRRQAQRFHLWGYFDDGSNRELTAADGDIQWSVHLVNSKTSVTGEGTIDPGIRTLHGPDDDATFANGTFLGVEVPLGEAHTDGEGRLIVVGGFGNSGSPNQSPLNFPNSAGWYDDISDGPITAQIKVGGNNFVAENGAWVICPPPRYAPTNYSITSLYDTIRQVAIDSGSLTPPQQPSFKDDIYPILKRALDMRYVTAFAFCDGDHDSLAAVIPAGPNQLAARQAVYAMLNPPGNMPLLFGNSQIKPFQRSFLQNWSQGQSVDDWPPVVPTTITPDGLTRAALENCVGAAFYPGIEATDNITTVNYKEPFRLDQASTQPGDLTKAMSRPWQNDFFLCSGPTGQVDCTDHQGHHEDYASWWPAARPIGIYTDPNSKDLWTRNIVTSAQDMVDNWFHLGFIVDTGLGKPVETERIVVCRDCFIITERNEIGKEEAQAAIDANQSIPDAFYLVIEGFAPNDLGITSANLSSAQLQALFPNTITLNPVPTQMTAQIHDMLLENNTALNLQQRITFGYNISFTGVNDFTLDVVPIQLNANIGGVTSTATIDLTQVDSPYMDHGPISWLSSDTRVFKLQPGGTVLGEPQALGNDPIAYIQNLLKYLRNQLPPPHALTPAQAFQAFENLPSDESAADLEWLPTLNGQPVYNFALCRIRYRATVTQAVDVRVFFRLFQTAATGTEYNSQTTYRVGGHPGVKIPVLGIQGGELVTIPFFAEARQLATINLNQQSDDTNKQTIDPAQNGQEAYMYYGCWLDINQPNDLRFPIQPSPPDGGPFTGPLQSIANLIRGTHQCMVTEINFDLDPITPQGISTASCDKLSQRNLAIDNSDNPGSPDTHRVQHTFSIHSTTANPAPRQGPDEIMIEWGDTPMGTVATLYMPGVRSSEVLDLAGRRFNLQTLERVDDHTLRCKTAGVTYVPIPSGGALDLAGLITLDLPSHIRKGQIFRIVLKQVMDTPAPQPTRPPTVDLEAATRRRGSNQAVVERRPTPSRHILGAFQFSILVKTANEMLPSDERSLAALERVIQAVPVENRWYPVLRRYLSQLGARVAGLGGKPHEGPPPDHGEERIGYTGKVAGLVFDRFGAFEGFLLDTEDGEREFFSREAEVKELAERAWRERLRLTVWAERDEPHRPLTIIVREPPAPFRS